MKTCCLFSPSLVILKLSICVKVLFTSEGFKVCEQHGSEKLPASWLIKTWRVERSEQKAELLTPDIGSFYTRGCLTLLKDVLSSLHLLPRIQAADTQDLGR